MNLLAPDMLLRKLLWSLIAKVRNEVLPTTLLIPIEFYGFCFAGGGAIRCLGGLFSLIDVGSVLLPTYYVVCSFYFL